jgi:excinuclease UvrABC ATPase subunit
VDQRRLGGGARSTLGTVTDINSFLRLLWSRRSTPHVGYGNAFSFNDPQGMCPGCKGIGQRIQLDHEKMFDRSKSLNGGAIQHKIFAVDSWYWHIYAESGRFDNDKPLQDYTDAEWDLLLHGADEKVEIAVVGKKAMKMDLEGVEAKFTRLFIDVEEASEGKKDTVARFTTSVRCPECGGARLAEAPRTATVYGLTLPELTAMDLGSIRERLRAMRRDIAPLVDEATERIGALIDMGLGYLTLDRQTSTLPGGESQRVKMVRHLGSSLVDVMYVFDEPTIGLHPRDVGRMTDLLERLRDKGNTVLVVEHDTDVIKKADRVVELGPKAGSLGGAIVYEGDVAGLADADTLTGRFLHRPVEAKTTPRTPTGVMSLVDATAFNLRGFDVDIPLGVLTALTALTGVAGSGKSTLVREVLMRQHPATIMVDQAAVATSSRSTPATWTGVMDPIRKLFAKNAGVGPSLFSFDSAGACPACNGLGVVYQDLAFLDGVRSTCGDCEGRRYTDEVLALTVNGVSISEALDMTAEQALEFFSTKDIRKRLGAVVDVGLGYLTLGQPLSTLSGGECQRLKLAGRPHEEGPVDGSRVYVLDEPTTGLHMSDCGHLLELLDRLVDGGSSVIVVEHNLDVIAHADHVVDLGPDGGDDGGSIVFQGTPVELLTAGTHTGEHLARHVGATMSR